MPGCGYLGTYSRLISIATGATLTLDVANGSGRIVQVLGVKKTGSCGNSLLTQTEFDTLTTIDAVYELGRSVVTVDGESNVAISNAYNPSSAIDMRCYLGDSILTHDSAEPTISSGTIATSGITSSGVTLTWSAAVDNKTATASLQYKVVRAATTASVDTVDEADVATTVTDWTANLTSTTASSLTASTTYAFVVLVRDAKGNKSLYTPVTATTSAGGGGGGGGGASHTVSVTNTNAAEACSGGGIQWSVSPALVQTIEDGIQASLTITRCNGASIPTLQNTATSCGGSITPDGVGVYSYVSAPVTADCTVEWN
jgi:hypothetical protein